MRASQRPFWCRVTPLNLDVPRENPLLWRRSDSTSSSVDTCHQAGRVNRKRTAAFWKLQSTCPLNVRQLLLIVQQREVRHGLLQYKEDSGGVSVPFACNMQSSQLSGAPGHGT